MKERRVNLWLTEEIFYKLHLYCAKHMISKQDAISQLIKTLVE